MDRFRLYLVNGSFLRFLGSRRNRYQRR